MELLIKTCLLLLLPVFLLYPRVSEAQDLFSMDHSLQYIKYLKDHRQDSTLVTELERIIPMAAQQDTLLLELVYAYKNLKNNLAAILRLEQYFAKAGANNVDRRLSEEYLKLLIAEQQYDKALQFINASTLLSTKAGNDFTLAIYYLTRNWSMAKTTLSQEGSYSDYLKTKVEERQQVRYKKSGLAATMSVFVPGSGKWYCKRGYDGFYALAMVGIFASQAYVGFHGRGVKSVYGWFNTGMGTGFYLGNIYGSYKAAIRYNAEINKGLDNEVRNYIYHTY